MTRRAASYLSHKQGTILKLLLCLISLIFIGILVTVYLVSKQANPILLDESGRPVSILIDRMDKIYPG